MRIDKTVAVVAHEMNSAGRDEEEILHFLRDSGLSIIQSMRVMMAVRGYSLADVKQVVHTSATWADKREGHEQFHEELHRAFEEYATEEQRRDKEN